jgi:hypothetical protein
MSTVPPPLTLARPSSAAVLSALWFSSTRAVVNLWKQRIKGLKQPRQLIVLLFGIGWVALTLGPMMFGLAFGGSRPTGDMGLTPGSFLGVFIALSMVSAWFSPTKAALPFTESEIAFVLPGPVSANLRLVWALLRGQLAVLSSSLFFALLGCLGAGLFVPVFITSWLLLTAMGIHGLFASFASAALDRAGLRKWLQRWLLLVVVAATVLGSLGQVFARSTPFATTPLGQVAAAIQVFFAPAGTDSLVPAQPGFILRDKLEHRCDPQIFGCGRCEAPRNPA